MTNRRDLLLIGAGLAGVAAAWQMWIGRPQPLAFTELEDLPGWRMLEGGQVSAPGGADFLTLGQGTDRIEPLPRADLPAVLYGETDPSTLAVFSDFFCPYCRVLTARLAARPDLSVTWHELPLLGPASEVAARALIATDLQGAYAPFTAALLQRGFRPSRAHMAQVADSIGLDGARLATDMGGPQVATRLMASRRAAAALGVYGTPGLTVGRTLVIGEIDMADLDRLVALEAT